VVILLCNSRPKEFEDEFDGAALRTRTNFVNLTSLKANQLTD
jgi:hypothetical protein